MARSDTTHNIIGRSFAGTPSTDPEGLTHCSFGRQLESLDDPRRVPLATFHMVFGLGAMADQGMILGASTAPSIGLKDNIGAVVVATRTSSNPHKSACLCCSLCSAAWPHCLSHGFPEVYTARSKEGKNFVASMKKRIDAFPEAFKVKHDAHAQGRHWYIAIMAVDPSAQGQKHCSRLMRALAAQADKDGIPSYLETAGHRNVQVYERFGYRVVEQFTLEAEGDDQSVPYEKIAREE